MISVSDLFKIVDSANVEHAFAKYMNLLDSEAWDLSALSRVMEVVK